MHGDTEKEISQKFEEANYRHNTSKIGTSLKAPNPKIYCLYCKFIILHKLSNKIPQSLHTNND